MNSPAPYLDIRNALVYQGQQPVFENLSLQFFRGQSTCVLGPNGAGKTTLLKLLTRELYPVVRDGSYVKMDGSERATLWELRKKIGFVSQDLQIRYDAHVKACDVVLSGLFGAIGMHRHFEVSAEDRSRADHALQRFGLAELKDRAYWHLSTGQQRKLLLARALIHQPQILVLDEPTSGLDLKAAHDFLAEAQSLACRGTTLLLVTHHVQEILPAIDRVVMLKQAKVVFDGARSDALTDQRLSALYDTPLTLKQHQHYYQAFPAISS